MKRLLLLITATAIFFGCDDRAQEQSDPPFENQESPTNRIVNVDDESIVHILENASETLTIGSNSFALEAFLWRDFMPILELEDAINGRGMISINWLIEQNSKDIPANITMVKQYVIYDGQVWEAEYENESPAPSLPAYKLERISRNGPKWGPNIFVDVIVEVSDSDTAKSYYIECKNINVIRTE
jgi:hypothetical protein